MSDGYKLKITTESPKAIKELGYAPHSFEEGLEILDKQLK